MPVREPEEEGSAKALASPMLRREFQKGRMATRQGRPARTTPSGVTGLRWSAGEHRPLEWQRGSGAGPRSGGEDAGGQACLQKAELRREEGSRESLGAGRAKGRLGVLFFVFKGGRFIKLKKKSAQGRK